MRRSGIKKFQCVLAHGGRCGATMLEMAFVLPILLSLMYVIIDLSRYWAVQGVITQGAQRGINLAIKVPNLERESNDPLFLAARRRIVCGDELDCVSNPAARNGDAVQMPLGTLVSNLDQAGSGARFIGFDNYDLGGASGRVNAALIRPGDACVTDLSGRQHCHPTVCAETGPCGTGARRKRNGEKVATLLETEPIVVVMPVRFRTLLPLPILGVYSMQGIAAGYREIIASGAYALPPPPPPAAPPPPPPSSGTPLPTPSPTPACPNNCSSSSQIGSCISQNYNCSVCRVGTCVCSNSCSGGG